MSMESDPKAEKFGRAVFTNNHSHLLNSSENEPALEQEVAYGTHEI